ncbi:ribosome maturation factor RimM [Agromyces subbeticus]|uniref:ribosome maturation factor RimM n=1 Tax=Agromyces subbeticus TaxID=293890 RepID=UPI0003B6068B|nr:ribosome maturation factor RimM [Agromyces subbeticus]
MADTAGTQLRVGRLLKAHGLKGAIKVELYTDDPDRRFVPGAEFSLQVPDTSPWHGKSITLRELRWYNGHAVGFFEGVDDRTAAEALAKAILWVTHVEEEAPEDDAWYDHQLVGLAVIRDGERVGEVKHVEHLPAQDLLIVKTRGGEVMVPFVSAIVPEVDLAAGTLTVTPPPGLFEELPESESEVEADPEVEATAEEADAAAEAPTEAPIEPGE